MIKLSLIGYVKNNRFYMMCLNTDILVVADSFEEAKKKIIDALVSYLSTFTHEEILEGKYIRKAPAKYWIKYLVAAIKLSIINFSKLSAEYDVNGERLSFA
jgi:hypothetical protein